MRTFPALIQLLEDSDLKRTLRLGNCFKQILELLPFEKGIRTLSKDHRLLQYLLLCLPLQEGVVESILTGMFYRLQSNLFFLFHFNDTVKRILLIKENRVTGIDQAAKKRLLLGVAKNDSRSTDDYAEFVEKLTPPEVQVNFFALKGRCLEYLRRVAYLCETYFVGHFETMVKVPFPVDIFDTLYQGYVNNQNLQIRSKLVDQFKDLRKFKLFGGKKFKAESKLGRILHPPPTINARESVMSYPRESQYDDSISYGEDEDNMPPAKEPSKHSGSSEENSSIDSSQELSMEQSVDHNLELNHLYHEKTLMIQNWLITEHTPIFEGNDQIKGYLSSDKDLEIFFQFIVNPFKIMPSDKVKRRLGKSEVAIHIEQRRTFASNVKFNYVPSKHNLYFLRGQKMLLVLLLRKNLKTLQELNPYYIDIFFAMLDREVFQNERSRSDMVQIFTLIQYILVVDPPSVIKAVIKHHLVYEMLGNLEIVLAKETLIALLTPGDQLFKVRDTDREPLMKYLQLTGFSHTLADAVTEIRIRSIMIDKQRASRNEKVQVLLESTYGGDKASITGQGDKPTNIFQGFFHSLFKFSRKLLKQPEDLYSNVLDIDRVREAASTNSPQPSRVSGQARLSTRFKFPRSGTPANLSGLLDDAEREDTTGRGPSLISDILAQAGQLEPHDVSDSPGDEGGPDMSPEDDLESLQRPAKRSKATKRLRGAIRFVMCYNLFLSRPQQASKIKKDKQGLSWVGYPENIRIGNQDLKTLMGQPRFRFDKCLKRESKSSKVMEVLQSILSGWAIQKNYAAMLQATRQNTSTLDWVPQIYFQDERLVVETLQQFLIKIQYHLENKTLFSSGYAAAKIFMLMCSEM